MKPIKLNDAQVRKIQDDVLKMLSEEKLYNGKIDLKYSIKSTPGDIRLGFSPLAFSKMLALIYTFDSEVGWHGTAVRTDDGFFVKDIMVYPQEVTGTTVNTDQEGYEQWLMSLDDEQFNECRMQGHSHVNMGTSPSSVDITHQESILGQLGDDDYYIFMIWNKKMQRTIYIFDMQHNIMYEDDDINIYIGDTDFDMKEFLDDAESLVEKKTYTGKYYGASKSKKSTGSKKDNVTSLYDDEDDTLYYWR